MVIETDTSLPSPVLPNLVDLTIDYDGDGDWLQLFHGAVLGKLEAITFKSGSERVGDFLEAFEDVALAASIQDTLSEFHFYTQCSWDPNYSCLLPFAQLTVLVVESSCDSDDCSSSVDDDVVTKLAQAMPHLKTLRLGGKPCLQIPIGVTAKGLVVLAHHCLDLYTLRIHFQLASLRDPPAFNGPVSDAVSTAPRKDCALRELDVGEIEIVPRKSMLVVALTLASIFPRIKRIEYVDEDWGEVVEAISLSRKIVDRSSKEHPLAILGEPQ